MLFSIMLFAMSLYLALLLSKAFLSLRYKRNFAVPKTNTIDKAITILQPILSGDPLLEQSLEHNLKWSHTSPEISFLWLVDEDDSETIRIYKKLLATYPTIKVIYCPPVPKELNPKAFKLQLALEHVQTPYIAIVDDDTMLSKSSLAHALYSLTSSKEHGLVTGLPYYVSGNNNSNNVWSNLVAHFVNNNSIVTYLPLLNFIEPLSINGMFYVMRLRSLEELGGFKSIWKQLSDDFAMACLIQDSGNSIIQTPTTHAVQTHVRNFQHYRQLMHRWFLFAQTQVSHQNSIIVLLLSIILGLPSLLLWTIIGSFIYSCTTSLNLSSFLTVTICLLLFVVLRHSTLNYLHKQFLQESQQHPSFSIWLSLLAELGQPFHMLHAMVQKRIVWRSRKIRLEPNGQFSYIQDTQ